MPLLQLSSTAGPCPDAFPGYHVPVMLNECCDALLWKDNGVYVDCTLGGGGHTSEILHRGCRVIGIDQDPDAIAAASARLSSYVQSGRLEIIKSNFRHVAAAVRASSLVSERAGGDGMVDGVLLDLGVCV